MSDCCKQCFNLSPTTAGAVAGTYCVEQIGGQAVWFGPTGRRITSATLINELNSLTDTLTEQANTAVQCEDNCQLTDVYKITIGTPGVRLRFWEANALPHSDNMDDIFTAGEDLNCIPEHPNTPDNDVIDTNWSHTDSTYGAGGTGAPVSQTKAEGWIIVPEKVIFRDNNGAVESGRVYIGKCGEKPKISQEWANTGTSPSSIAEVNPGIYFISVLISDPSANSGFNLQYSTDGGITFANVPASWLSADLPSITCEKAWVCEKAGTVTLLDRTDITVDGISYAWCPPCSDCCSSDAGSSEAVASCEDIDTPLTVQTGVNSSIPAGFKSVTINNITGITTINGQFQLGTGRRVDSISFSTDRGNCVNETLPAYTLAGGTWQWIGHLE